MTCGLVPGPSLYSRGRKYQQQGTASFVRKEQQVRISFWLQERGLVGVKRTLYTDDILYLAQATQDALNLIQHAFSGHNF